MVKMAGSGNKISSFRVPQKKINDLKMLNIRNGYVSYIEMIINNSGMT